MYIVPHHSLDELRQLYRSQLKNSHFHEAKTPGLSDRKSGCIDLILPDLRSLNRGNFRFRQNAYFLSGIGISTNIIE